MSTPYSITSTDFQPDWIVCKAYKTITMATICPLFTLVEETWHICAIAAITNQWPFCMECWLAWNFQEVSFSILHLHVLDKFQPNKTYLFSGCWTRPYCWRYALYATFSTHGFKQTGSKAGCYKIVKRGPSHFGKEYVFKNVKT